MLRWPEGEASAEVMLGATARLQQLHNTTVVIHLNDLFNKNHFVTTHTKKGKSFATSKTILKQR